MRHRDVAMCAQGALALYLSCRYHIRGEAFPTFGESKDWFFEKVIQPTNNGWRRNYKNKQRQEQDVDVDGDDSGDDEEEEGEARGDHEARPRNPEYDNMEESMMEATAARLFLPNDGSGGIDLHRELIARPTAGPSIESAPAVPADEDREVREVLRTSARARAEAIPRSTPISYATQCKQSRLALNRTDIVTSKLTHIGRGAAACVVSQAGLDLESQLRRHGHWNQSDVMTNCYIQSFREFSTGCSRLMSSDGCYTSTCRLHRRFQQVLQHPSRYSRISRSPTEWSVPCRG